MAMIWFKYVDDLQYITVLSPLFALCPVVLDYGLSNIDFTFVPVSLRATLWDVGNFCQNGTLSELISQSQKTKYNRAVDIYIHIYICICYTLRMLINNRIFYHLNIIYAHTPIILFVTYSFIHIYITDFSLFLLSYNNVSTLTISLPDASYLVFIFIYYPSSRADVSLKCLP